MKLFQVIGFASFAALALAAADAPPPPQIAAVQRVYILPMSRGMDQFLADRLTALNIIQVVSDPQNADAVFTDHLGANFEESMDTLYPKPAPPAPPKADDDTTKKTGQSHVEEIVGAADKAQASAPVSTFGRGRGTFFLVDRHSRNVLWSTYRKPAGTRPDDLRHTADYVARQFKQARTGKQEE